MRDILDFIYTLSTLNNLSTRGVMFWVGLLLMGIGLAVPIELLCVIGALIWLGVLISYLVTFIRWLVRKLQ